MRKSRMRSRVVRGLCAEQGRNIEQQSRTRLPIDLPAGLAAFIDQHWRDAVPDQHIRSSDPSRAGAKRLRQDS